MDNNPSISVVAPLPLLLWKDNLIAMDNQEKQELLIKIFQIDQKRISSLDSTKFTIKGWFVTLASALTGFALKEKQTELLYIGIVATTLLGVLDCFYRQTQLLHVNRVNEIEHYFQKYFSVFDWHQSIETAKNLEMSKNKIYYERLALSNYQGLGKSFWVDYKTILFFYGTIILLLILVLLVMHLRAKGLII